MDDISLNIPNDIIDKIKYSKLYKGQIRSVSHFYGEEPIFAEELKIYSELRNIFSIFPETLDEKLYLHQYEILKEIEGNNIVIHSIPSYDKKIVILSYIFRDILKNIRKVIYIVNSEENAKNIYQLSNNLCLNAGFKPYLDIEIIYENNKDEIRNILEKSPDFLIINRSTINTVKNLIEELKEWESSYLFIIENLDRYLPEDMWELREFIEYFESNSFGESNYIIFIDIVSSPEIIINELLKKKKYSYISSDTSKKNSFHLLTWLAPFEINLIDWNVKNRINYYEELLTSLIHLVDKGQKILIWQAFATLGKRKLRLLKEEIQNKRKELIADVDFFLVDEFEIIPREFISNFDLAIILGIPRNIKKMMRILSVILKDNANAIIVQVDEPLSFYYINNPKNIIDSSKYSSELLFPIELKKEEKFTVRLEDTILTYLPSEYYPFKLYNGAIFNIKDNEYKIVEINAQERLIKVVPCRDADPITTVPLISTKIKNKKTKEERKINNITLSLLECEMEVNCSGYRQFYSFFYPGREKMLDYVKIEGINKEFKNDVIEIQGLKDPHLVKHLLKIYCEHIYSYFDNYYHFDLVDNNIIVFPIFQNIDIKKLYNDFSVLFDKNNVRSFLKFINYVLLNCPCKDGCPNCADIIKCNKNESDINKIETMKCLYEIINDEVIGKNVEFLINGFNNDIDAKKYYEMIKDEILKLFKEKFLLDIKNVYPLEVENKEGKNYLGLCQDKKITIVYPLTKPFAYSVIAHEYAHNWEFEEADNIPVKDEDILEGFADWISFKVCEYYGLESYMKEILKTPDFSEYNIKPFIKLENNIGFYGVLELIKNGKFVNTKDNIEINLEEFKKTFF